MKREDLLKALTVKTESFELESLKALGFQDAKVTLRELTISQTKEFNKLATTTNGDEAFIYACRQSMIEPEFFTEEELKTLNKEANTIINEVLRLMPLIGKSPEEKEKYNQLIEKITKEEEKQELSKEDLEKK